MKSKIIVFATLLILTGLLTTPGCKKPSPVAFTPYGAWTIPSPVSPVPGSFVDLQRATTIDLQWSSTNASGDPQNWDVYFGTSAVAPALVSPGQASQTYTATVTIGTKYYWKVVGTDANGIKTTSAIWGFETIDPNAPMKLSMTWTTDAASLMGINSIDPTAAVDLRLLIYKADSVTLATPAINTSGFEDYNGWSSLADGVYYVASDISDVVNLGDLNKTFDVSINLTFSQRGLLTGVLQYGNAMTTANPCSLWSVYMAKVTKSGSTYTVEPFSWNRTPPILHWSGTDATYAETGTYQLNCTGGQLGGLLHGTNNLDGWMYDWWGEVIVSGGTCNYTVSGNTVTIPLQYFCNTTYLGAPQPAYSIQGTGTINTSGPAPVWNLSFDLKQGSTWIGAAYWGGPFIAVLNGSTTKSLTINQVHPPKLEG